MEVNSESSEEEVKKPRKRLMRHMDDSDEDYDLKESQDLATEPLRAKP